MQFNSSCLHTHAHAHLQHVGKQKSEALAHLLICRACCTAGVLSSHRLLELLQQGGEAMSQEELLQALQILTGAEQPEDTLPEYVDARTFTAEVLGFAG